MRQRKQYGIAVVVGLGMTVALSEAFTIDSTFSSSLTYLQQLFVTDNGLDSGNPILSVDGTTSAVALNGAFHVVGNSVFAGTVQVSSGVVFTAVPTGSTGDRLLTVDGSGTVHAITMITGTGGTTVITQTLGQALWTTGTNNTDIVTSGTTNVGINTAAPTARLDVNGTLRIRTVAAGSGWDSMLTIDASGNVNKLTIPAGSTGDNLGNHTATQNLDMTGHSILHIAVASITSTAKILGLDTSNNVAGISCTDGQSLVMSGSARACSTLSQNQSSGGPSGNAIAQADLTSCTAGQTIVLSGSDRACRTPSAGTGDNLGNHLATQNLNLSGYKLVGGGNTGLSITSGGVANFGSGVSIAGVLSLSSTLNGFTITSSSTLFKIAGVTQPSGASARTMIIGGDDTTNTSGGNVVVRGGIANGSNTGGNVYIHGGTSSTVNGNVILGINPSTSLSVGNVGINVANPLYKLQVAGDVKIEGNVYSYTAGSPTQSVSGSLKHCPCDQNHTAQDPECQGGFDTTTSLGSVCYDEYSAAPSPNQFSMVTPGKKGNNGFFSLFSALIGGVNAGLGGNGAGAITLPSYSYIPYTLSSTTSGTVMSVTGGKMSLGTNTPDINSTLTVQGQISGTNLAAGSVKVANTTYTKLLQLKKLSAAALTGAVTCRDSTEGTLALVTSGTDNYLEICVQNGNNGPDWEAINGDNPWDNTVNGTPPPSDQTP